MKIGSIKHKDVEVTNLEGEPREIVNFVRQLASAESPEEARKVAEQTSGAVRKHGGHIKTDVLMSYIREWAAKKPGFSVYDLARYLGKEPYTYAARIRDTIRQSMPEFEIRDNLVYPKGSSQAAASSPSISVETEKPEPDPAPLLAASPSSVNQILVEPKPYYELITFPKKEVQLAGTKFTIWKEGVVWKVTDAQGRTEDVGRDYDVTSDLEWLRRNPVSQKELVDSSKLRPTLHSVLIGLATGKFNKNYLLDDVQVRPKDRQINLDAPIQPNKLLQFLHGEGMRIGNTTGSGVSVINPKSNAQAWVKMGRGTLDSLVVKATLKRLGIEYE